MNTQKRMAYKSDGVNSLSCYKLVKNEGKGIAFWICCVEMLDKNRNTVQQSGAEDKSSRRKEGVQVFNSNHFENKRNGRKDSTQRKRNAIDLAVTLNLFAKMEESLERIQFKDNYLAAQGEI